MILNATGNSQSSGFHRPGKAPKTGKDVEMTQTLNHHESALHRNHNRHRARPGRLVLTAQDLMPGPQTHHNVARVKTDESLLAAYVWLRICGATQLLVMGDNNIAGIVDEHDLLMALSDPERDNSCALVSEHMNQQFHAVPSGTPAGLVLPLLRRGLTIVVKDGDRFLGLVTKPDYINYIRQQLEH